MLPAQALDIRPEHTVLECLPQMICQHLETDFWVGDGV